MPPLVGGGMRSGSCGVPVWATPPPPPPADACPADWLPGLVLLLLLFMLEALLLPLLLLLLPLLLLLLLLPVEDEEEVQRLLPTLLPTLPGRGGEVACPKT